MSKPGERRKSSAKSVKSLRRSKSKLRTMKTEYSPSGTRLTDEETLSNMGYRLGRLLGEGSFAKVYYTEYVNKKNPDKKVLLACKAIDMQKASDSFVKKFFPRELAIMCIVKHPHIVKVHSVLKQTQKFYVFIEFCARGDMMNFMKEHGALKEFQARIWFTQLLEGVAYLHNLNIAHRDLKCENILLSSSFKVKIADLGFSRYFKKTDSLSETYCGSVSYAPPEVISGTPYNPMKMDVWGCGIILFAMLNSSLPFGHTNGLKKMHEDQIRRNWKLRDKVREIVSFQYKTLLHNLLEPNPAKRPACKDILEKHPWIKMSDHDTLSSRTSSWSLKSN